MRVAVKDVRKLLSDALLEICERKSLDHVTVTEIAAQAGLTRQVFYRYFFDKYDLAKFIHICDFYGALDAIISNEDCDADVWIKVCNTCRFYESFQFCGQALSELRSKIRKIYFCFFHCFSPIKIILPCTERFYYKNVATRM